MSTSRALRRPTLSFAVTSGGSSGRLRALLELVRPHVDEVVLAVDRAGDPSALDACADLADRRLGYELDGPPSKLIGWIRSRCSGDWILHLDDDEVPSAALLEALPGLMAERRPLGYGLLRRWVYPSSDRYLGTAPWGVESLERLIRNVPGAWRFDGRVHTTPYATAEIRHVALAFYHLDLVAQPEAARRAKAVAYETFRPGVEYRGLSANALYLPEAFEDLETAPVPPQDIALVDALLSPKAPPERPSPRAGVEQPAPRDIAAFTQSAKLPADDYRATLRLPEPPESLTSDASHPIAVTVRNQGSTAWPWGGDVEPLVRLGYRWRRPDTGEVVADGRALLTETVRPGHETLLTMTVGAPEEADEYVLEVDLVHEHVRWFGCGVRARVTVEPSTGTGLLGGTLPPGFLDAELTSERARLSAQLARATAERRAAEARLETVRTSIGSRLGRALARPLDTARGVVGRSRRTD
jgi:hypothetical protein